MPCLMKMFIMERHSNKMGKVCPSKDELVGTRTNI